LGRNKDRLEIFTQWEEKRKASVIVTDLLYSAFQLLPSSRWYKVAYLW